MDKLITISMILVVLMLGVSTVDAMSINTTENLVNILTTK